MTCLCGEVHVHSSFKCVKWHMPYTSSSHAKISSHNRLNYRPLIFQTLHTLTIYPNINHSSHQYKLECLIYPKNTFCNSNYLSKLWNPCWYVCISNTGSQDVLPCLFCLSNICPFDLANEIRSCRSQSILIMCRMQIIWNLF